MAMVAGKIAEWLTEEGAAVRKGDEILEIETEKAVVALESPEDGILLRQVGKSGDEIAVGGLLGVIGAAEQNADILDEFIASFQSNVVPTEIADEGDPEPSAITIEGITIGYRSYPSRRESDSPPIVLIHGFGGDQSSWVFVAESLSERHDVFTLDLPAHGASSREVGEGTLASLATIVHGFVVAMGLSRTHIVGHSLGAAIAVQLATDYPQRVVSLVLISGAGAGTRVDKNYIEGFISANRRKQLKPYIQLLFADAKHVTREMIERVLMAKRIEGTETCLRKIAEDAVFSEAGTNVSEILSRLSVPAMIIWGGRDQIAPIEQSEAVPANIKIEILRDSGHMVQVESARAVNALVSGFVAGH